MGKGLPKVVRVCVTVPVETMEFGMNTKENVLVHMPERLEEPSFSQAGSSNSEPTRKIWLLFFLPSTLDNVLPPSGHKMAASSFDTQVLLHTEDKRSLGGL